MLKAGVVFLEAGTLCNVMYMYKLTAPKIWEQPRRGNVVDISTSLFMVLAVEHFANKHLCRTLFQFCMLLC